MPDRRNQMGAPPSSWARTIRELLLIAAIALLLSLLHNAVSLKSIKVFPAQVAGTP